MRSILSLIVADPAVLARDLFRSADCNIVACDGDVPTQGLLENVAAVLGSLIP